MDCLKFQDSISDYLEGAMDSRQRAECAAHRLICRDCRELHADVRATMQALGGIAQLEIEEPEGLETRIIAATTAGEMLSCHEFDKLLERYFDGVILAPTFQTFQAHFADCRKCRRLMIGIEDVIGMCHEAKAAEVEVPDSLHDRIVAATVGKSGAPALNWREKLQAGLFKLAQPWLNPQMAVAVLIFAASALLILSRFGSFGGAVTNTTRQGQWALNQTGHLAIQFGHLLRNSVEEPPVQAPNYSKPLPSPTPAATGQMMPEPPRTTPVRHAPRR